MSERVPLVVEPDTEAPDLIMSLVFCSDACREEYLRTASFQTRVRVLTAEVDPDSPTDEQIARAEELLSEFLEGIRPAFSELVNAIDTDAEGDE